MIKSKFLIAALMLSASAFASAGPVSYTQDKLLGSADMASSGVKKELAQLNIFLAANNLPAYTGAYEQTGSKDVGFNITETAKNSGLWYIDLVDTAAPGYFSLKFGTGNTGKDNTYFFQNIGELDKLVFTNADVNFLIGGCGVKGQCNSGKLSHYTLSGPVEGGGGDNGGEVPEPASIALLGLGLLGMTQMRKRKA